MSTSTRCTPQALYRIEECPDLMVDGHVGDERGNLVFLSLWGRDTAIQSFLARLTLGRDEQGLDHFHLILEHDSRVSVFVPNTDHLEKRTTRAYRQTLFGTLVHVWLFDTRCLTPDRTNGAALTLLPRGFPNSDPRLWHGVRETCALPLLDHWRDTVLTLLWDLDMLGRLPMTLGPLEGVRLTLDLPRLTDLLGERIRAGALTASPQPGKARAA
ncbi:hypothetical protein [Alloalcanivorax xenomutans]|uniref:hypothetical protein n=1 Tax=Alloalcanivorax xenomutans TaxID=1094342 RepID=UPI003C4F21FE